MNKNSETPYLSSNLNAPNLQIPPKEINKTNNIFYVQMDNKTKFIICDYFLHYLSNGT